MVFNAYRRIIIIVINSLLLGCFSGLSLAESSQEDYIFSLTLEQLLTLQPVEVTARKRTENKRDIPIAMSVMSDEVLDNYLSAAKDYRFLSNRTPSMMVESSFDRLFPRFYIRGLGNTDFDINASQPVSVVYDGIVQENPMLKGFPIFDYDRIEILRGPQGSLFGRNTPAGVIKLESNKPSQTFFSYANLSLSSQQTLDFEGAINGSLNQNWSARLSLLSQQRKNWIDNAAPGFEEGNVLGGFDEFAGRLQLRYQADETMNVLFNLHHRNFNANPAVFRANILTVGSDHFNNNYKDDTVFLDAANRIKQSLTSTGGNITVTMDLAAHQLTLISGYESVNAYSRGDVDGGYGAVFVDESGPGLIPFPAESSSGIPSHRQLSQEIRLASKQTTKLDYQIGFFYFDEQLSIDNFSFNTFAQGEQNGFAVQNQQTQAWALFGSIDYELLSDVSLSLGLRYSSDEKRYKTKRLQSPIGAGVLPETAVNIGDDFISWDVSTVYEWSEKTNVYFRVADSFRAPSIQGRIIFSDQITTAQSEHVRSFEIGLKSKIFADQGKVDLAIYRYKMNDQQVTAVGGGENVSRLINVEQTDGYGFELDTEFIVNEYWRLIANMSYNSTQINDPLLNVAVCAQCTVTDPVNSSGFALVDGNNLPYAPALIYNINLNYQTELGQGTFLLMTDWSYRSEIDFFLYRSKEFVSKALLEGGVRAAYQWQAKKAQFEIALFVRNITDQQVLVGGVDFNNLTGIVNEPRFIGVEFSSSF